MRRTLSGLVVAMLLATLALGMADLPVAQAGGTFNIANGDIAGFRTAVSTALAGDNTPATINLAANGTYTFTDVTGCAACQDANNGDSALPVFFAGTSDPPNPAKVRILIINGNGATVIRSSAVSTPSFRFFFQAGVDGSVTVNNLTVKNFSTQNTAGGGAFLIQGGDLTLNSVTLDTNSAPNSNGGAVYNDGRSLSSKLTIDKSIFTNNSAQFGGAVQNQNFDTSAQAVITNSTFTGNTASNAGGAIRTTNGGDLVVVNSTFYNNTGTTNGGAISSNNAPGTPNPPVTRTAILNSTFVGNSSSGLNGGGFFANGGTLILANSLFVSNNNGNCNVPGTFSTNTNNLEYNGVGGAAECGGSGAGSTVTATNPVVGAAPANNGGPTNTFALAPGSAAINGGDQTTCATPPAFTPSIPAVTSDQRGFSRDATCDIGAFEFAGATITKAFGAASIAFGGTTSLTITITNPDIRAFTGLTFTDNLPAGLTVATPSGLVNACGGTPSASGSTVSLTGGTLAASSSCQLTVNVKGTGAGAQNNQITNFSTTQTGTASSNTASVTVAAAGAPTISKQFGAASILINTDTTLTITISNSNAGGLTGLAFTDNLPAGLTVSNTPGLTNTCNGTPSASGSTVSLTGGTIGAGSVANPATCTVTVNVTGTSLGQKSNTIAGISYSGGTGPASNTAVLTVSSTPVNNGLAYYPLPKPIRILDTRTVANTATDGYYNPNNNPNNPNGVGSIATLAANATLTLKLAGITYNGVTIPSQAQAIEGNTQVAAPGAAGFLTVYPAGSTKPVAATMLYNPGQFLANSVTLTLGTNGGVSIYSFAKTDVLLDISGYYAPVGTPDPNNLDGQGQPRTDTGLLYFPLSKPVRLLDTRKVANTATDGYYNPNNNPNNPNGVGTVGTFASGATKNFKVSGISYNGQSIPSSAKALVGNIQVAAPPATGFLTVYPGGTARPVAATMLYNPGQFLANAVNLTVATDGTIAIYAFAQSDILLDVTGYFAPASTTTGGLSYNPLSKPVRLLDTRTVANPATDGYYNPNNNPNNPNGVGTVGTFANGATKSFKVGGITYNSQTIPTSAKALVGNIQVAAPPGVGFLTAYPGPADASGANRPVAATMLYNAGQFLANSVVLTVDTSGVINLYAFASTDLLLDASGYFA